MTNKIVTDSEISALRSEAFRAGDALQGYICHLALQDEHSEDELQSAAWLEENTCLDSYERRELCAMCRDDARAACAKAIRG